MRRAKAPRLCLYQRRTPVNRTDTLADTSDGLINILLTITEIRTKGDIYLMHFDEF
jgi:hypothetical protein